MATSKFTIIRKDLQTDPSVVDSDGLTIGRLVSNDLPLNHPEVSRTHAGIKEVGGDYWIFNLSNANGTILNGAPVDSAPLAAGDVIQLGPFTLLVSFTDRVLTLTVEVSVNPMRVENAGAAGATVDQAGKTMMLNPAMLAAQQQKAAPGGTQRLAMTGKLTGMLAKPEELALKVFWEKRQRDEGKMAERTDLKPNLQKGRVGKIRFNWRSSTDLRRPWPVGLFLWGTIIVAVGAIAATFLYKQAYTKGPLADVHTRTALAQAEPALAIAKTANANSCTTCHSLTKSMAGQCAECHTTPGFKSTVSHEHEMAGVTCSECHGQDHRGNAFRLAAAETSCDTCHRQGYVFKSVAQGKDIALQTPHGGANIGYPVTNGQWTWAGWPEEKWKKRGLPKTAAAFDIKGQFHVIHVDNGKPLEQVQCSDCHTKGFEPANITKGVRESCASCHGDTVAQAGASPSRGAQCTSCHQQHTEGKDPYALVRAREVNAARTK